MVTLRMLGLLDCEQLKTLGINVVGDCTVDKQNKLKITFDTGIRMC